jgi:hypothetical protein
MGGGKFERSYSNKDDYAQVMNYEYPAKKRHLCTNLSKCTPNRILIHILSHLFQLQTNHQRKSARQKMEALNLSTPLWDT